MNLREAKRLAEDANSHKMLEIAAQTAAAAKAREAKSAKVVQQNMDDPSHPVHDEHKSVVADHDAAKQMVAGMFSKAVGAEHAKGQADAQTAAANAKLSDAQAKETEARAGVISKIDTQHITAGNAAELAHGPAAAPEGPNLAGAKKTAKNISTKAPK